MKLIFPSSVVGALFLFIACMPSIYPPGHAVRLPQLTETDFLTKDDIRLPVRRWMPESGEPGAIIIAVHGFNDYSNFFSDTGRYLSTLGIASYAFDQRGFGASPSPGYWSGTPAYTNDLEEFTRQIKGRHPNIPVYLLGESMGGAVVIVAMQSGSMPDVDGVILSAPAVWGWELMPWYQQLLLWVTAHSVPWMTVTGEGVGVKPSDNIEMLRALGRDPLVIKETRVEAVYGLVNLMDNAMRKSSGINGRTLFLYGEKDEIIPRVPIYKALSSLPVNDDSGLVKVAIYENGYHMLLRDLQADIPWKDIVSWIQSPGKPLPSGADERGLSTLAKVNDNS